MMGIVKGLTAQSLGLVTRWRDREAQMWEVAKKYVREGDLLSSSLAFLEPPRRQGLLL